MRTASPFVGRATEQEQIRAALNGAAGALVLAGPPGVGKTRLADETLTLARAHGMATARTTATHASSGIPLGALAPVLPRASEIAADFHVMADAVAELAGSQRLALLVDDAHLLDDASATVLLHLAQAKKAFVVVTLRTQEKAPDAVMALWKDGLAERIDLTPLARTETESLIEAMLGGPVEGATVRHLWDNTRGHPLLLRELIIGAVESGQLHQTAGGVWHAETKLSLTSRLGELIEIRIGTASRQERDTLDTLALGEPLGLNVLGRLHETTIIEALEARSLIEVRMTGARWDVRLAHPLYGEFLSDQLPLLRARGIRQRLADAVESFGARRREDALRVATWRLDGGGRSDGALMVTAARQAGTAHDFGLAERLARAVLDDPQNKPHAVLAGQLLGEVVDSQGRHDEAETIFTTIDLTGATDQERACNAHSRARNMFWGLSRHEDAARIDIEAESAIEDQQWRDRLTAQRATFDLLAGRPADAVAAVAHMLEADNDWARAEAAIAAAPALSVMGRATEAIAVATRGFESHLRIDSQLTLLNPGIHVVAATLALGDAGRLREAWESAENGYRSALDDHMLEGQAWFSLILGRTAMTQGRVATGARWYSEAAALYAQRDENGPRRWAVAGTILGRTALGDIDGVKEALRDLDDIPPNPVRLMEPDIMRARAWAQLVGGDLRGCVQTLRDAADEGERTQQRVPQMSALHDLVRIGCVDADIVGRLAQVAGLCDGPIAAATAAYGYAVLDDDPRALEEVAKQFATADAWLFAGEAEAAAATAYRKEGQLRAAAAADRRAAGLAKQCEGARTPALAGRDALDTLTRREREISLLAAQGHPSRTIAGHLHLSVRTVENHLQRVYLKLGIEGRQALAAALDVAAD